MAVKQLPPISVLNELFSIDVETGVLRWKVSLNRVRAGSVVGHMRLDGQRIVRINNFNYRAHRIVYAILHGFDPSPLEVDHIDGNRRNNAPSNLRLATHAQNCQNKPRAHRNNTSGHRNVCWDKTNDRWVVIVHAFKNQHHIGMFKELQEAIAAATAARKRLHMDFAT